MNTSPSQNLGAAVEGANWLDVVREQVASLRFGTIEIVVHNSRVVQIEKTERLRLGSAEGAKPQKAPASSSLVNSNPIPGAPGTSAPGR